MTKTSSPRSLVGAGNRPLTASGGNAVAPSAHARCTSSGVTSAIRSGGRCAATPGTGSMKRAIKGDAAGGFETESPIAIRFVGRDERGVLNELAELEGRELPTT